MDEPATVHVTTDEHSPARNNTGAIQQTTKSADGGEISRFLLQLSAEPSPTVLFVTPAETEPHRLGCSFRSAMNLPLTAQGEQDAAEFGRQLKALIRNRRAKDADGLCVGDKRKPKVQALIGCHPFKNCRQTAQLISKGMGLLDGDIAETTPTLIPLRTAIKFVHEGSIRVVNRLISLDEDHSGDVWIASMASELTAYAWSKLSASEKLLSYSSVSTLWILVVTPETMALYFSELFNHHLIMEFSEATWPDPLEMMVIKFDRDFDGGNDQIEKEETSEEKWRGSSPTFSDNTSQQDQPQSPSIRFTEEEKHRLGEHRRLSKAHLGGSAMNVLPLKHHGGYYDDHEESCRPQALHVWFRRYSKSIAMDPSISLISRPLLCSPSFLGSPRSCCSIS